MSIFCTRACKIQPVLYTNMFFNKLVKIVSKPNQDRGRPCHGRVTALLIVHCSAKNLYGVGLSLTLSIKTQWHNIFKSYLI